MAYITKISTGAYKPMRASRNNWENGTTNDFMAALDGWRSRENNLRHVRWRIEIFLHGWPKYEESQKEEAMEFLKSSKISYFDKLCGFTRTQYVEAPGFHQGYCNIDNLIETLRTEGVVRIPFEAAYDMRQYPKNMDGCFMEIKKA